MGLRSGILDLGSRIRKNLFRIPDQGVKMVLDPGSGSATLLRINFCTSKHCLDKQTVESVASYWTTISTLNAPSERTLHTSSKQNMLDTLFQNL
jgi:hypothetical protein